MFEPIHDLPPGIVGFAAHGRITIGDRLRVLEPAIVHSRSKGLVRMLYAVSQDFTGYDHGGLYDEAVFGSRHFTDFERIAFVSNEGRYSRAVAVIAGLMPADLRQFRLEEIHDAMAWLGDGDMLAHLALTPVGNDEARRHKPYG